MVMEVRNLRMTDHSKYSDTDIPCLNICEYNIVSGGNSRLPMAARCMRRMNMDLGFFTETKLVDGFHTQ